MVKALANIPYCDAEVTILCKTQSHFEWADWRIYTLDFAISGNFVNHLNDDGNKTPGKQKNWKESPWFFQRVPRSCILTNESYLSVIACSFVSLFHFSLDFFDDNSSRYLQIKSKTYKKKNRNLKS